ncbi:hypothetical protein ACU610_21370 [Geodermatophilus sp. URMC 61]|uniref:hypothetical protein n=1 Tax=Geodermatophilus sp. URMC 61 TaxID=3423411 RepID=UPI00406C2FC4
MAQRIEARLVHDFRDWLVQEHGLAATGLRIPYAVEARSLRADLFITTPRVLVEAKASTAREHIRMAIGQLLDYQRWVKPTPNMCILTPGRPADDLLELLGELGIGAAWRKTPARTQFVIEPEPLLEVPAP